MSIVKYIRKRYVVFTFLLSYVIVLFIPLIIGSLAYSKALNVIEENVIEANLSILEQTKDILDSQLSEIEKISYQLAADPRTALFFDRYEPVDNIVYYDITKYIPFLKSYWITNSDFVLDFFIYFNNMETIVSSKTFYDVASFYGYFFKYNNWSFTEFSDKMLNEIHNMDYMPSAPITIKDSSNNNVVKDSVAYVQSIPIGYTGAIKGVIFAFIDNEKIVKLLNRLNIGDKGWVYISDKNGNIITGISYKNKLETEAMDLNDHIEGLKGHKEHFSQKEKMMMTYTTSSRNGWKYVSVMPLDIVMSKVNYIKKLTWSIVLVVLFVGLLLAYLLAYRNTKPIKSIIKTLKEFLGNDLEEVKDEYSLIQDSVGKIISRNVNLQDLLEKQIPLLRMEFFSRLFRGDYNNTEEIEAAASNIKLELKWNKYVVIMVIINGYGELKNRQILSELNMKKLILKDVLIGYLHEKAFSYDVDENKVAWLFTSEYSGEHRLIDEAEKTMKAVYTKLIEESNISLSFAAGGIYDKLTDIWRSFNEAGQVVNYNYFNNESVIMWHDKMPKKSENYSYDLDVELKLINFIKSGDKGNMKKLLDELYCENFTERNLSPKMIQRLAFDMSGTLIKLSDQINVYLGIDELIESLDRCVTPNEVYDNLIIGFNKMCSIVNEQKKSHNVKLKEKIIEYIDLSYTDPDLCLSNISDKFNLSETYLSQFFKEQTGENFTVYLEKVRIQHASSLLSDTDLSIKDISQHVGYNSDHVFRRAFKRIAGISPSEYRSVSTQ